jgi:hypothetical protein
MAFSYNLESASAQTVLVSRTRLFLGDTVEDAGPLPDGSNLQDNEILLALALTGDNPQEAATLLYRTLAARWATLADVTVGPRKEALSQVAARYQALAEGGGGAESAGTGYALAPARDDGYHQAYRLQ